MREGLPIKHSGTEDGDEQEFAPPEPEPRLMGTYTDLAGTHEFYLDNKYEPPNHRFADPGKVWFWSENEISPEYGLWIQIDQDDPRIK